MAKTAVALLSGCDNTVLYPAGTHRARLQSYPEAHENFAAAQAKRLILREERNFEEAVDRTPELPSTLYWKRMIRPMSTHAEKGRAFRALHERKDAFIIPNPCDAGAARLLAHLGFDALATTSAGYAFSVGRRDNTIERDEMMAHVSAIVAATDLPVSADLENGFGDAPEFVAETIRQAAAAGVAGGSIEDMSRQPDRRIYEFEHAVERIRAAAEEAHVLPFVFTLTARAENYLVGRPDLRDTIRRLQAYQEAGADVLYAPGLTSRDDIATVVRSVDRPVNVLMGMQGIQLTRSELSALGVKRISVGSALARAAFGAFLRAAGEMREHGTFTFAEQAASYRDISDLFSA